jgi:5-dehydro-2-deoxygluconokinase
MALGYDGKLYILAFDHRGSFQKKMFGIEGDPTPEQTETSSDAKHLIYEGMVKATESSSVPPETMGVLVDEQFGAPVNIPGEAKEAGFKLAMPVEKSGQNEFDFQYDDRFGDHILSFDPDFTKVLVRYNPEGDAEMNERQLSRLKRLADWLHEHDRKFLFELLVPAEEHQLEAVGGDTDRYDAELRPELMRRAIEKLQDDGVEVDIWKIEGVDSREDAEMLAEKTGRTADENRRLAEHLSAAREQLELGEALGYGDKSAFADFYKELDEIEAKTADGGAGKGWFDRIKNSMSRVFS